MTHLSLIDAGEAGLIVATIAIIVGWLILRFDEKDDDFDD